MAIPLTLAALLERGANRDLALLSPGREALTYGQLREHVGAVVQQLNRFGIGRNDRIALVLPNGPAMASAFVACATAATVAPLNPAYKLDELAFFLGDLGVHALVVGAADESAARLAAARLALPVIELSVPDGAAAGVFALQPPDRSLRGAAGQRGSAEPDDLALLLHTSGTTSRPKLVPLSQRNLCASAGHVRDALMLIPADRCLNVMPLFHIHGLIGALLASLSAGASVACTPGFNAFQFFAWMQETRPTWYTAVPSIHQAVLQRRAHTRGLIPGTEGLRLIRSSSAALPPRLMAEVEAVFGAPVIESYGMTEAAHQMASNPLPPRARKPGTVGLAAGPEVAVMNPAGGLLGAGETGEVVVRGPNVMRGYLGDAAPNAVAFTDGWFRTGDQGRVDAEGYLTITGRLKEIINRGGEKIGPREVDEVLLDHPAVAQAVTFAVPHDLLGEDVAAAVVLRPGAIVQPHELRAFAAERLADFKVPRRLLILAAIPTGPTGKPQRIGLAERLGLTPHRGKGPSSSA